MGLANPDPVIFPSFAQSGRQSKLDAVTNLPLRSIVIIDHHQTPANYVSLLLTGIPI